MEAEKIMREIPVGKALVAVEVEKHTRRLCDRCFLIGYCLSGLRCGAEDRKDGKNVVFKLVDFPGDNKAHES
jgi:hypothetical protein